MIKLTIGIPTYNRLQLLKKQIHKLSTYNSNIVEILISDNGSVDGTKEYLESVDKDFTNIKVLFSDQNLGFDENIKKIYHHAMGDYVWFLSEDDPINISEISHILSQINQFPHVGIFGLILNGNKANVLNTN